MNRSPSCCHASYRGKGFLYIEPFHMRVSLHYLHNLKLLLRTISFINCFPYPLGAYHLFLYWSLYQIPMSFFMMLSYYDNIICLHFGLDMPSSIEVGSLTKPMSHVNDVLMMWSKVLFCSFIFLDLRNPSLGVLMRFGHQPLQRIRSCLSQKYCND